MNGSVLSLSLKLKINTHRFLSGFWRVRSPILTVSIFAIFLYRNDMFKMPTPLALRRREIDDDHKQLKHDVLLSQHKRAQDM